jgi:vitamin B12 transporter
MQFNCWKYRGVTVIQDVLRHHCQRFDHFTPQVFLITKESTCGDACVLREKTMKRTTIAGLIGLAFAPISFAEEAINLHDIIVTANRVEQNKENALADVTIIDRQDIERSGQSTLAEILSTQPGIEIESNGGVGATSNIHIRGTNSQSVVVLIDGMRIASATLGTTNFSQIQPELIERIEIVKGPASSLYGSDAIGGVIQIFTRKGQSNHASATAGIGSHNTHQLSATLSGASDSTRFAAGVSNITTDGISSLRTHTGLDADKDAYRNFSFNANISHTIAEGHDIGAQAYISQGRYQFDGSNFPAYQDLEQSSYALTSNNKLLETWTSHLRLGQSIDDLDSTGSFGNSKIRTTQDQFSWQNDINLPLGTLVLAYDRLEDQVTGNVDYSTNKRTNNGYLASYLLTQDAHTFKLGLRRDYNSQFSNHTTGNIAYGYRLNDFWKASASFGTAFRAPTFNDLYWPFQSFGAFGSYEGNANLKPETSRNKEFSVSYDQGHHKITATAFHNKINNLIVCCQGLFNDSPANVGSATIQGLSLAYEGWFSDYHLRASTDFQDPKDDDTGKTLARRSKVHGAIWLGKEWGDWAIGSQLVMSGKRYNDAANAIELGGYTLLNLTAKYNINPDWSINANANNVFDKKYALATTASTFNPTAPDYNTDGSNLFVNVRYSPSK